MNILVTGGAGFIGSHIVDKLIKNHKVAIIDNLSAPSSKNNINPRAIFYKIDICNDLDNIFKEGNFDLVVHTAAQVLVPRSIKDPKTDANINIMGSINIIENCIKYNVKKIIYLNSGGAIVGDAKILPTKETDPIQPLSPYGVSKYVVEKYLEMYSHLYRLKYTSLRLSNIYGSRQTTQGEGGVVEILLRNSIEGKNFQIFGDGNQTRDFLYVDDLVEAVLLSIKKADNQVINISSGKETTINKLYDIVKKTKKSNMVAMKKTARKGDIYRSCLDPSKAKKLLGWKYKTSLEQGIKFIEEYYKKVN